MKPIAFMRLKKVSDLSSIAQKFDTSKLVVQGKLDGWKIMASHDRDGIKLYTRRGTKIEDNFPQVVQDLEEYIPVGTAVLGEITVLDEEEKQDIYKVQSIAGSDPDEAAIKTSEIEDAGGRVTYFVYDVLESGGKIIADLPLRDRLDILQGFPEQLSVKTVETYPFEESEEALEASLDAGGEGLVIKPIMSRYVFGKEGENEPSGEWIKYKPREKAMTEDVIVRDYKLGKPDPDGYRKAIFPAYQKLDGRIKIVGNLSGMDRETEKIVKKMVRSGKPVTIEVRYQEITPSGKFRHMGFVRMRPDKPD